MRKRRTREHVIADLSVNHVERFVLLAGHVADRILFDYGYDLILRTFNRKGELEERYGLLQLKASDHPQYLTEQSAVAVRIDPRDLAAWRAEDVPVILIIYDAQRDVAFWVHIQALSGDGGATVRIPTDQRVGEQAVETWRYLKGSTGKSNDTDDTEY